MKTDKKKLLTAALVLVIAVAAVLTVWLTHRPGAQAGDKHITVAVVTDAGQSDFTIDTDAEYLRGALEQEGLIEGTESEYGLFVTTVNGVTADDSQQQWWCFTRSGEMLETGVDSTPIADGEAYEITLTTGW